MYKHMCIIKRYKFLDSPDKFEKLNIFGQMLRDLPSKNSSILLNVYVKRFSFKKIFLKSQSF